MRAEEAKALTAADFRHRAAELQPETRIGSFKQLGTGRDKCRETVRPTSTVRPERKGGP